MRIFSGDGQPCVSWEIVHIKNCAAELHLSSPNANLLHLQRGAMPAMSGFRCAGLTGISKGTNGSP